MISALTRTAIPLGIALLVLAYPASAGPPADPQAATDTLNGIAIVTTSAANGALLVINSDVKGASATRSPPEAQGEDNTVSQHVNQEQRLEEVVVTARRRNENAQTVPIAITVMSQQALQDNNVQALSDLQTLIPSMSTTATFSRDAISVSIRGQGQTASSGAPGVVAYLNEVPIPTGLAGDLAGGPGLLFDLENVQVLKGPQGTLFGKNSVGGDLLLQTARPTAEFGGHLQVGYGNYNDREFDGAINIPISDTLLTRLAINGQLRDGFTRLLSDPNHPNGTDADNRDFYAARETVTFRPSDHIQNDTIVTFSNYESHGSPPILTAVNPTGLFAQAFGYLPLLAEQQSLGIRAAIPVGTALASSGNNLGAENISRVELSDELTFRNIVGFDRSSTVTTTDFSGSTLPLVVVAGLPFPFVSQQYSEEAQLLGKSFADRLDWVLGGFYLHDVEQNFLQAQTYFFTPQQDIYGGPSSSKAIFGQGTYDLSAVLPRLKLTGGIRYTSDSTSRDSSGGSLGSVCVGQITDCGPNPTSRASSNALTWTSALDYEVVPDTLLYFTSRRGYRPGGYNAPNSPVPEFAPEFVQDYELGIKSDWRLGGAAIRTNADLYYQNYQDIQVQQTFITPAGIAVATNNAAAARITGAEFEVLAQLTHDLQLGATFDYLDFQYKSFAPGVAAATIATLEGTRTVNAPPRKYGLTARYQLPLAPDIGELTVRADWHWQATSGDYSQTAAGLIDSYGLLNASANWDRILGKSLDVSLFGSNLTNKDYAIAQLGSFYNQFGIALTRFGEPRMYGIRLRYRFGAESKR